MRVKKPIIDDIVFNAALFKITLITIRKIDKIVKMFFMI